MVLARNVKQSRTFSRRSRTLVDSNSTLRSFSDAEQYKAANNAHGSLAAQYGKPDAPLASYATIVGVFNALFAGYLLLTRGRKDELPERVLVSDIALIGVASHKLSRVVARDRVMSWLRAPFAKYKGDASGSEVDEQPRGTGMRLAVGELLTCPYCLSQWMATFLLVGLTFAPRVTRLFAAVLAATSLSDFLHTMYDGAQQDQ